MTTCLIAMIAVLGADPFLQPVASPNVTQTRSIYSLTPVTTAFYDGEPATQTYEGAPQTFSTPSPSQQTYVAPQGQPYLADPNFGQQPPPYGFPQPYTHGTVGPQPYRLGWSSRYDMAWMPNATASNGRGDMEIFEANMALRNSTGWPPGLPNWIMSFTPEFNLRSWQGPGLVDLPAQVYRFAGDIELAAPGRGPWGFHAGFTPAIVSDFESPLDRDGFNFDGRGYITFQATPQLMLVAGAMYWDRVVDRVLPYGGFVWTPNDMWEWRILFPKARVSVFLGNTWGAATWLYGAFEYNSEAYQIVIDNRSAQDKIEIRDLRATVGLRFDNGSVQSFVEGGWVFERQFEFMNNSDLNFDLNSGFIGRLGIRF
ncbi:MAG: hypothetical protein HZA46_03180 [Planctomycetales bacterium]|nr:hypothetical protein [Planctomycetales bacterium]